MSIQVRFCRQVSNSLQTMFANRIARTNGPRCQAIVQVIANAITSGQLAVQTRLPTHRALADQLGVDVSTVSRAYAKLGHLGLISGKVGRGTFVAEPAGDAPESITTGLVNDGFIDLSHNFPLHAPANPRVAAAIESLRGSDVAGLMASQLDLGHARHRNAGRSWLALQGMTDMSGEIAVTAGAQHALFIAASVLTEPGDCIMTEALTYFGLKSVARTLGLELVGLEMDEEGITPESLENACVTTDARVLYCSPTVHNPTGSHMGSSRRQAIVEVARRHDVRIIEDDVYSFLVTPRAVSLCQLAPDIVFHVNSLSKAVSPGLRVGFLRYPTEFGSRVSAAMHATMLMASPLTAEVATRMIQDGSAEKSADERKVEIERRQCVVAEVLGEDGAGSSPNSFHLWLPMKNGWSARDLCYAAAREGVGLAPGDLFATDGTSEVDAVRICVAAARDLAQLRHALSVVSALLSQEHQPGFMPVVQSL